jgi:TetR/AcrR family transcriptional repressor of bet genes
MAKKGYAAATTVAIAEAARLAPGLVHYHFESKHRILLALVEQLTATLDARIAERLARAGADPRARLLAFVDAHVALGAGTDLRAVAAWVALGTEALRDLEVRRAYQDTLRAALAQLRKLVSACLRAEGCSTSGAAALAATIMVTIEGAYRVSAAAPGTLARGFATTTLRRLTLALLAAEPRVHRRETTPSSSRALRNS